MVFEQYKYQNDYNKTHYARLSINVAKDQKDIIDAHWKKKGFKSFNAYVNHLIENDMNGSKSITVGDIKQSGKNNSINIG